MYQARPEYLCVTRWAMADDLSRARARRLAAAFGHPNPPVLSAPELAEVAQQRGWLSWGGQRTGATNHLGTPDVVLNAVTFDADERQRRLQQHPLLGHWLLGAQDAATLRDGTDPAGQDTVCQTALELHCGHGCLHACDYCHIGPVFNIMMNLEALAGHFRQVVRENPWCRLWKLDNQTDTITLEPEYGASEIMVNLFAEQRDAFLMLYTKSDNVDHLLGLDHRGQTLISWSLAAETAGTVIERGTPAPAARIAAMRRCQEAGYPVRVRLSPICPVLNWREEATALLEALFAQVQPEIITMDVLGWMSARQMRAAMDIELFDSAFRDFVIEQATIEPGPHRKHIFPHEMRLAILRHYARETKRLSPRTPVSICVETREMWRELGPELGMEPESYACCCGPTSVPGHPLLKNQG